MNINRSDVEENLVKYGDTFYIYGYSADGTQVGWLYQTGDSTNYVAVTSTFNSSGDYPPVTFTILPAEKFKVESGSSGAPSQQSDQFTLNSNGVNVLGKPVSREDVFYLGLSSVLGAQDWYTSASYTSVTGSKGQVWLTDINNYPYNGQIKASFFSEPSEYFGSQYLTYGTVSFYLSVVFNDIGVSCIADIPALNTKNSPWVINDKQTSNSNPELTPALNITCSSNYPAPSYFVFVPTSAHRCVNFSCQALNFANFQPSIPLFTGSACGNLCPPPPATYGCVNGVCQATPGGVNDPTCGGSCPQASYVCTGGQCLASASGTLSLQDCTTICGSYTCGAGVCLAVTAGSTAGNFSSQADCSASCSGQSGEKWWIWGLVLFFLLLFLAGVIVAIVLVLKRSKKE